MNQHTIDINFEKYWILILKDSQIPVAFDTVPDDAHAKYLASEAGDIPNTETIDGYQLEYDTKKKAYILPKLIKKEPFVINTMYSGFIPYTKG